MRTSIRSSVVILEGHLAVRNIVIVARRMLSLLAKELGGPLAAPRGHEVRRL